MAVSADDFFGAIRELCNMNMIPQFYDQNLPAYQDAAIACDFVFSVQSRGAQINKSSSRPLMLAPVSLTTPSRTRSRSTRVSSMLRT